MKKSSFVVLMLGTLSGLLFSIGMCMALLPEWNLFKPGIIFGAVGIIFGLITLAVWRKLEHKAPVKFSKKSVFAIMVGIFGALMLGLGMCFCMVWNKMILGILIGVVGILVLLCLIPIIGGLKD